MPEEVRQRWRIVFRRAALPRRTHDEDLAAWEAAMVASGLPVAGLDRPSGRPRLAVAAPLPSGLAAERELLDVFLTRRVSMHEVREALEPQLPPGHALVDLHDVWTGAPPLPAALIAAEYRVQLASEGPSAAEIADASRQLLAATALPRERTRGAGTVRYDLRPLLDDVHVADAGPPPVLRIRTRFHPQQGAGRPGDVLAALEEVLGRRLAVEAITRERLVTAEDR